MGKLKVNFKNLGSKNIGSKEMAIEITPSIPTQVVLKLASKNQSALQDVSVQISSGLKHQEFKGYAEDGTTEKFLAFKSTIKEIETHMRSNNLAISRAKTADSTISDIQDVASSLAQLITQRRNSASGDDVHVDLEASGMLDKITGMLNTKFDGRYLFSGSKTNTPAVGDLSISNIDTSGTAPVATASYYNGDSDIVSVRSSDSEVVSYGILANDDGFKKLIGAAHLAIEGHNENSDTKLQQAMDMVNDAIDDLTSTRASGLIAVDKLQKSNTAHQDFKLLVQNNLDEVSQTNIVEATAKMSELQAIVQAGYLAFSRLSSLRLTDFLR